MRRAASSDSTGSVVPGTIGTPAPCISSRARVFEPIASIALGGGPMKTTPASAQACAKAALLRDVQLASDDGSGGHHGFVTHLLERELDEDPHTVVYACGPAAMLEGVRGICARRRVPAQLALEAPMACGFGACYGCVVPARGGR